MRLGEDDRNKERSAKRVRDEARDLSRQKVDVR